MSQIDQKKIIVADDEDGIREVFCMIIESNFDHQIIPCDSAESAIEAIKTHGGVDLIFSDFNMGKDNGGDIYRFLQDKNLNVPFVLCSTYMPEEIEGFENFFTDHPHNAYLQKPFSSEQIIDHIAKTLTGDAVVEVDSHYIRIRPERFKCINNIKETFNVFIKLSKKKYVKVINEGETDAIDTIEKYIKKGIDYIYLEKDKYEAFENAAIDFIFEQIDALGEESSTEEKSKLVIDSIDSIQSFVKNLGVNERTIELIDKVVEITEESLKKAEGLSNLLDLLKSRNGYLKDHAYLTSFIACSIADKMSWKTEGIWKKIITASLFQNISLENEDEAKIFYLDSDDFKALDQSAQERVKKHPKDSVKMISQAEDYFSEDTRKMIQNHHEQPSGNGFPRGLDATKISPLEALFVISTSFADALLKHDDANELSIVAQDYNEIFNKGNFKKPYQGFLKAFIKLNIPSD